MDEILALIPIVAAAIVPPALSWFRANVARVLPGKWIPVMLPIAGGVVAGLAHLAGVDAAVLQTTSADPKAWETVIVGVLAGGASVGVHQAWRGLAGGPDTS